MKKILFGAAVFMSITIIGTGFNRSSVNSFSGYVEAYYQYDFNKPADNNRPGFIYSHNRHNEFNLTLVF